MTFIRVWIPGSSTTSFRKGSRQRNNQQNGHYLERRMKFNSVTPYNKFSRKLTSPLSYKKIMKVTGNYFWIFHFESKMNVMTAVHKWCRSLSHWPAEEHLQRFKYLGNEEESADKEEQVLFGCSHEHSWTDMTIFRCLWQVKWRRRAIFVVNGKASFVLATTLCLLSRHQLISCLSYF
jgi:hypothetical protein